MLNDLDKEKKEIIILGDLNVDYLKQDNEPIKQSFQLNGFSQLIKLPTRITETTATLIDVIQTNKECNISYNVVIPADLSDHDLTGCVRKMHNIKYQPKATRCRNYRSYDVDFINNDLLNKDWNPIYQATSPNTALKYFISIIKETLDQYAPFVTKQIKGKPSPWISKNLSKEMNTRDQLLRKARKTKKTADWISYERKRNFVKNEVQRLKRNYLKSQLDENAKKPDRFRKIIFQIYTIKSKNEELPKTFHFENKSFSDKKDVANGFCKFFSMIANTLKSKAFPLANHLWRKKPKEIYFEKHQFAFKNVMNTEVLKYLRGLKRNSAVGLDEIPPSYLKDIAFVIAKPLTHIINCSLISGIFPAELAKAKVTPIFKSGKKENFDN